MLTPKCKVYDGGFFTKESNDPDNFYDMLKKLRKKFDNEDILSTKKDIDEQKRKAMEERLSEVYLKNKIEDGLFRIRKRLRLLKHKDTGHTVISSRNAKFRTYRDEHGMLVSEDGRYVLKSRMSDKYKGIIKIKKREPVINIPKRDGRYVIGSRKYYRIKARNKTCD